nr:hypothetical protein [Massilibacterium senegalense]
MDALEKAHRHSNHHRLLLERDSTCGCFYCLNIFHVSEIKKWVDQNDTALCPYCGIDAVISKSSGSPITSSFLEKMNRYWF